MNTSLDISALQTAHSGKSIEKQARAAADGFESFFLYQMINTMDVKTDEEFGGGFAEDMFRGFRNEFMAENITKQGSGIGLADQIYTEILKTQEVQ